MIDDSEHYSWNTCAPEGIVFFLKQHALAHSMSIAILQEEIPQSVTIDLSEYIVIKGRHSLFCENHLYYDAYFTLDSKTSENTFHSFKPTTLPANVNERDLNPCL